MNEEDKLLIEAARNNDASAQTAIYNKYRIHVWWTILGIVKDTNVADDLTADVFIKVLQRIHTFTYFLSLNAWLKTIAINTALDYIRDRKREGYDCSIDDDENSIQLDSEILNPEDKMIYQQELDVVSQAMSELNKRDKDLIEWKLAGKSYKTIGDILNVNEEVVKSRLYKARQRLRAICDKIS
jgi:RNA polymerase sigma-70 factor (ECF subfamily)